MVYTATNRALAMAEVLVHLSLGTLPGDYCLATLWVPDNAPMGRVQAADLPAHWHHFPPPEELQKHGNAFVRNRQWLALQVPSAVVAGDFNLLLNPLHPAFSAVKLLDTVPFGFQRRLFRQNE
jgi:RES domain-containing protein